MRADYEKERPFGVHIEIDHKKPGRQGVLRAIATFDHQDKNKQIWNIEVRDEDDDIVSDGHLRYQDRLPRTTRSKAS